jgi:hypothetical protein
MEACVGGVDVGGGFQFNADAHRETAIIKDRIKRNDD